MGGSRTLGVLALVALAGVLIVYGSRPPAARAEPTTVDALSFFSGESTRITVFFNTDDVPVVGPLGIKVVAASPQASGITLTFFDCWVDAAANGFQDDPVGNCHNDFADQDADPAGFEWTGTQVGNVDVNSTNSPWRLRLTLTATCQIDAVIVVTAVQETRTKLATLNCFVPTPTPPTSTPTRTPIPTITPTPGPPAIIRVVPAATTVGCGSVTAVVVTVRRANDVNVADGTNVALATTLGSINPVAAVTFAGQVHAVYIAPETGSGTANLTATTGGLTGSANVQVTCGTVVPATGTPVPGAPVGIRPPSTGDGGLSARPGR